MKSYIRNKENTCSLGKMHVEENILYFYRDDRNFP